MRKYVGVLALCLLAPSAAVAQEPGDWVLAQWQGGSAWYPGVVQARSGDHVRIRYDDGSVEMRPANQVRPFDWRAGSRIVCRYTDGQWYDATIVRMDGGGLTLDIRYDDGVTQRTNTGRCRVE